MPSEEKCPNPICSYKKNLLFKDCPTCGEFWWYPNVEEANQVEGQEALESKYKNAALESDRMGCRPRLNEFEKAVEKSFVVVNMEEKELLQFLQNDDREYKSYIQLVEEGVRAPYSPKEDDQRRTTETKLFGRYASAIRYGALSIDGYGLESYGNVAVKLKSDLIRKRTSFFVENSLAFMKRYNIQIFRPFPKGFRAIWDNKGILAVSKAFDPKNSSPNNLDFAKLLLNSTHNKLEDRFIEAHIYDGFTNRNFESVKLCGKSSNKVSKARAKKFVSLLKKKNIILG